MDSMKDKASVCVIIPVFKTEKMIDQCIGSILNQTFEDWKIILVDDGSPDNCSEICDKYVYLDSRIHAIHKENGGAGSARNAGIDFSLLVNDCCFISFIDSDDMIQPTYFMDLLSAMENNQANICVCGYKEVFENNVPLEYEDAFFSLTSPEDLWVNNRILATVPWGKVYKKELFTSVRFPTLKRIEDEFTIYKVLFSVESIAYSNAPLYYYYQSADSLMRSEWSESNLMGIKAFEEQIALFENENYKNAAVFTKRCLIDSLAVSVGIVSEKDEYRKKYYIQLKKKLRAYLKNYKEELNLHYPKDAHIYKRAYPLGTKVLYYLGRIKEILKHQ